MGEEAGVFAMVENPQPPASLADPQAGLVGTDHGSGQQPGADGGAGRGEALARARENVDQRAFADGKAEQVAHQARQPLEGDALGEAQIDDEGPQIGAERRARLQPRRRSGLEAPGATRADAPVQAHPRDLGRDRRNLDPVIDLARLLRALRDVGPAMPACARQNVAPLRRVRMQRPMRARMRLLFLRRLLTNSVVFLWPWLGGRLELSGVLGGRSSLARNAAISARSVAISPACRSIASACANATPIRPSRSSDLKASRFIPTVNQKPIPLSNPPNTQEKRGEQLILLTI